MRIARQVLAVFQLPDTKQFLKVVGANYPDATNVCKNCMYLRESCPEIAAGYCNSSDWDFANKWIEKATAKEADKYVLDMHEDFYKAYGRWPNEARAKKPRDKTHPARKLQLK